MVPDQINVPLQEARAAREGYVHRVLVAQGLSFDIGVEGHNYEPWSLEEIESKMSKLEVCTRVYHGH